MKRTMRLMAASGCAKAWRLLDTASFTRTWKKDALNVFRASKALRHPYVQLDRGFVFIHIPKTAGTSLRKALGFHLPFTVTSHASARDVLPFAKGVAPKLVSISFVRNPYTRFLSLYNYARQDESIYHSTCDPQHAPYGKHANFDILQGKDLEECAELLIQGKLDHHFAELSHWRPQVEWLINERGDLAVDFIGRLERVDHDLAQLTKQYGIRTEPLPWLNKSEAGVNSPQFSKRALELVRLYYKRDFEMLGYDENDLKPIEAHVSAEYAVDVRV